MKPVKLLVALMGLGLAQLASAGEGFQVWNAEYETYVAAPMPKQDIQDRVAFAAADDAGEWIRSEWHWNEEYQMYVAAPILSEDPFQERQVYSNYYTDFVRFGEALRIAHELQQGSREELVWRDEYADYVPRSMAKGSAPDTGIVIEQETKAFLAKVQQPCPDVAMQAAPARIAFND